MAKRYRKNATVLLHDLLEDQMNRAVGIIFFCVSIATTAMPLRAQIPGFGQRTIDQICSEDRPTDDSRTIDRLTRRFNLTDPQKAALKDWADTATRARSDAKTAICADKPDLSTAPTRAAFAVKVLENRLNGLKAIQPKLQAFYDSLDDKQKAMLNSGGRVGGFFSLFSRSR
jgi:hypothetical protein